MKKDIQKLRSYSLIFSSTNFSKLLKNGDYDFMNNRINAYDKKNIGSSFSDYRGYIKHVYRHLLQNYQNEYIYKNTLIEKLILKKYALDDTNIINEFRVGNSIADMVLFNGTSKVFEIKTELDSTKRLIGQLSDYRKLFKQTYIVTHENLVDKYKAEDNSAGIIALVKKTKSFKMVQVRSAEINELICPYTLMRVVRTNEYKNIVNSYYGYLPPMNSFNMFEICEKLISKIPNEILNTLFINELKKRKTNSEILSDYPSELRQLGLALNLSLKKRNELISALKQPISI
ncbi:MAG TPA: hypothetical protein ENH91_02735 [Leeuwenhoekiella sp.]|nr:hypothetical protein [Leeuwenhoekiella sp.]